MSTLAHTAAAIVRLEELAEFLRDRIDGADECRGHDQTITRHIQAVEVASGMLAAYAEHFQATSNIANQMQKAMQ